VLCPHLSSEQGAVRLLAAIDNALDDLQCHRGRRKGRAEMSHVPGVHAWAAWTTV